MLVIPLALVEDPAAVPLGRPPVAELYVRAGEKYVDGRPEYKELPQVMDLSPLGKATGSQLRQGGISVVAPGRFVFRSRSGCSGYPPCWAGSGCWACSAGVVGCRVR